MVRDNIGNLTPGYLVLDRVVHRRPSSTRFFGDDLELRIVDMPRITDEKAQVECKTGCERFVFPEEASQGLQIAVVHCVDDPGFGECGCKALHRFHATKMLVQTLTALGHG